MGCEYKARGFDRRMAVGAVLLASGTGSHVGGRPRALLQLGGDPLIVRQLAVLTDTGINEVVVPREDSCRNSRAGQPGDLETALREQWLAGSADRPSRNWRERDPQAVRWLGAGNRNYHLDIDTPQDLEHFVASTD